MITREMLCATVGVDTAELQHWVERAWVVPEGAGAFREIDVARARLIRELRHELGVEEDALSLVLSLLDQLYSTRRQMRALREAMQVVLPDDAREKMFAELMRRKG